jgi:hypothetical protein
MLETFANGGDPFETLDEINMDNRKLFKIEADELGNIVDDIRCIMTEYFIKWPENSLTYVRKNRKAAEHTFEIELFDGVKWRGILDSVAKSPNKLRWLVERKTFNRMPSEDHRWRNIQSATYFRANDIMGWAPLDGACWDYIWSKPPDVPQILKSGAISRRQIQSLPTRIKWWFEDRGLPIDRSLMQKTEVYRNKWFDRIFTTKKEKVVDFMFADFERSVREMVEHEDKDPVRTIDLHCDWCEYEALCRAELTGGDVDYVKEKEFFLAKYTEEPADEVVE